MSTSHITTLVDGEIAYRRDAIAADFRRVGGRDRHARRQADGRRWHLHRTVSGRVED